MITIIENFWDRCIAQAATSVVLATDELFVDDMRHILEKSDEVLRVYGSTAVSMPDDKARSALNAYGADAALLRATVEKLKKSFRLYEANITLPQGAYKQLVPVLGQTLNSREDVLVQVQKYVELAITDTKWTDKIYNPNTDEYKDGVALRNMSSRLKLRRGILRQASSRFSKLDS